MHSIGWIRYDCTARGSQKQKQTQDQWSLWHHASDASCYCAKYCSLAAGKVQLHVRWNGDCGEHKYNNSQIIDSSQCCQQDQTVDRQQPFSHPILTDIIRQQWFGRGKADVRAYQKMVSQKMVFGRIIVLVVTAVWGFFMY